MRRAGRSGESVGPPLLCGVNHSHIHDSGEWPSWPPQFFNNLSSLRSTPPCGRRHLQCQELARLSGLALSSSSPPVWQSSHFSSLWWPGGNWREETSMIWERRQLRLLKRQLIQIFDFHIYFFFSELNYDCFSKSLYTQLNITTSDTVCKILGLVTIIVLLLKYTTLIWMTWDKRVTSVLLIDSVILGR